MKVHAFSNIRANGCQLQLVRRFCWKLTILFKRYEHTIESNDCTSQEIVRCNNHFQYFRSYINSRESIISQFFSMFC